MNGISLWFMRMQPQSIRASTDHKCIYGNRCQCHHFGKKATVPRLLMLLNICDSIYFVMHTKIRMKEVPLFVLYSVLHFMYGFRDFVSTNTSNDSDRSDRTLVSLDT